jgi:hypothetical protein
LRKELNKESCLNGNLDAVGQTLYCQFEHRIDQFANHHAAMVVKANPTPKPTAPRNPYSQAGNEVFRHAAICQMGV